MTAVIDTPRRRERRKDSSSAGQRGTLTLSEKVVGKIAAQSASELDFVGGFGRGVLGIGRQVDSDHRPRADVSLSGTTVTVFLDVALDFPVDLDTRSAELRRHVTSAIERSTGLQVRRIDISIKALTAGDDQPRRRLQ